MLQGPSSSRPQDGMFVVCVRVPGAGAGAALPLPRPSTPANERTAIRARAAASGGNAHLHQPWQANRAEQAGRPRRRLALPRLGARRAVIPAAGGVGRRRRGRAALAQPPHSSDPPLRLPHCTRCRYRALLRPRLRGGARGVRPAVRSCRAEAILPLPLRCLGSWSWKRETSPTALSLTASPRGSRNSQRAATTRNAGVMHGRACQGLAVVTSACGRGELGRERTGYIKPPCAHPPGIGDHRGCGVFLHVYCQHDITV